jgi:hypothetical protein
MSDNKIFLLQVELDAAKKNLAKMTRDLEKLKGDYKALWEENITLKRMQPPVLTPAKPKEHIRLRKNGKEHTNWGVVMSVVKKANGLTARELSHITGFDRYAIYAAARRANIKLKPAND